jgi:glycyl-tRNA synthetase
MDMGFRYDVVDAVLTAQSDNPAGAARAVKQLAAWVGRKDWNTLLPGYARCVRILRSAQITEGDRLNLDASLFSDPAERELFAALQPLTVHPPASVDEFLTIVVQLIPFINTFFDQVLVMAEDAAVKENRLALLYRIAALVDGIADLSKLEGF